MDLPIVYSYPCRWEMVPGRHRYLMEAMSAHVPVYFLNWPKFGHSRLELHRPYVERMTPAVTVIHNAFGVRFSRGPKYLGRLGALLDGTWLKNALRACGLREYIYWLSAVSPRMLWGMQRERLVYDCIDPCFDSTDQSKFDRAEGLIARQARVVFATAESLLEKMRSFNSESHLLMNACSEEYSPETLSKIPRPHVLDGRSDPIVGYMGTFDSRVDVEVLATAARRLPELTFVLVGRVNSDQEPRVSQLRQLPNVLLPGAVSVEEGKALTAHFNVGLIPFLPGEIGDAINPVKMWMYLMAGKPVVTTDLRECRRQAAYVNVTRGTEEFVDAIKEAVTASQDKSAGIRRTQYAMNNRWKDRAKEAMQILRAARLFQNPVSGPFKIVETSTCEIT